MLGEAVISVMLGLGFGVPPQLPSRGALVDRESQPVYLLPGGTAGARILLDSTTVPGLKEVALTELIVLPGTVIPEHTHDTSAEILYILEGHAKMTLDGKESMVRAGMAIYIPAGVKHSMTMDSKVEPLRALQIYSPGGPQERFKKGEPSKE